MLLSKAQPNQRETTAASSRKPGRSLMLTPFLLASDSLNLVRPVAAAKPGVTVAIFALQHGLPNYSFKLVHRIFRS